jgi:hypothetical protein
LGAELGAEFASEKKWTGPQATPNQRHVDFSLIFRDQEVEGSNPFAPTTSLQNIYDFWFSSAPCEDAVKLQNKIF